MNVKLSRWGNSLAVRIPAGIAKEASLSEGDSLAIDAEDKGLRLNLVESKASLEELVEAISAENRHDEISWGEPVGAEAL